MGLSLFLFFNATSTDMVFEKMINLLGLFVFMIAKSMADMEALSGSQFC